MVLCTNLLFLFTTDSNKYSAYSRPEMGIRIGIENRRRSGHGIVMVFTVGLEPHRLWYTRLGTKAREADTCSQSTYILYSTANKDVVNKATL